MKAIALGVLGWTPGVFWSATPDDFDAAMDGWLEKNGGKSQSPKASREELQKLMDRYPDARND